MTWNSNCSVGTGMGVEVTFETSGFTAQITGISDIKMKREWYEKTHFLSPVGTQFDLLRWMEQCPGDIGSVDDITCQMLWNVDTEPPIDEQPEVITFQCPPKPGQSVGAKLTITGGLSESGGNFEMKGLRAGSFVIKVTGPPEWDYGDDASGSV